MESVKADLALVFRFVVELYVGVQRWLCFEVPVVRAYVALELSLLNVSCLVFFQRPLGGICFTTG